jgi:hypothetical protein
VITEDEYFVTFPSAASLRICMRGGETVTPLNKMRINLKESDLDPGVSSMLQSTWVKIFDIPSDARNEDSLKEISNTFGLPRSIDPNSLNGKGPVRVQVDCKDPKKLRGKIEIFLNTAGFKFCIEAEGVVWGLSDLQKPGDSPGDDPDDRAEDEDDEELGEEWDRHRLQNKEKSVPSGSSGKGSSSYKQQSAGFPFSYFSPLVEDQSEPKDDGASHFIKDKSGSQVLEVSKGSSDGSIESDRSSFSLPRPDGSPDKYLRDDIPSPRQEQAVTSSWNNANMKAQVMEMNLEEEIREEEPLKSDPEVRCVIKVPWVWDF